MLELFVIFFSENEQMQSVRKSAEKLPSVICSNMCGGLHPAPGFENMYDIILDIRNSDICAYIIAVKCANRFISTIQWHQGHSPIYRHGNIPTFDSAASLLHQIVHR